MVAFIPANTGSVLFAWGLECPEDEIDDENCYMLYNDEVIWVTALAVTLLSLVTLYVYTLLAAVLFKLFCQYRTVYETPWVRYIARRQIGWKGYVGFFYLMLVWVLNGVLLGALSFANETDVPEGSRSCLSPYGLSAIVMAGLSGFFSILIALHATYAKFFPSNHTTDSSIELTNEVGGSGGVIIRPPRVDHDDDDVDVCDADAAHNNEADNESMHPTTLNTAANHHLRIHQMAMALKKVQKQMAHMHNVHQSQDGSSIEEQENQEDYTDETIVLGENEDNDDRDGTLVGVAPGGELVFGITTYDESSIPRW